ncbi:transcriptional regulator [Phyllobacterium myrsinacearum]|jgi:HTH-type transcriptional regulator, cell division transcriptional repressor|uniref:Transcriptional regulator n=1 Tax=Phyllobacterium myrsinacearum TaxID=28101 RepID=A0A2S9JQT0_9HYPH|nr:transcriptional regulator [Phyllobacterium myrsinacearum]PRD55541.1 transcriptional regulator [Phyllobacterium myrsinacearum]PWV91896.1 transcriptional regulator with XRE-family HTH domain [Phyllobacterium myrsinacearum]RZS77266.1 transcriptional regulator with XRE-family HTH domain [Phyllobacterium myrsinacearum]RZV05963.1 transcriptional regulator with XRE-family HTH domain [Phyllobacterium myrsinacearum]
MFHQTSGNDFTHDDTLGGRISLAREYMQISSEQAASQLGVATSTWKSWERDRAAPRSNRLAMMAGILAVTPVWLLTGMGSGPNESVGDDRTILLQRLQSATAAASTAQQCVQHLARRLEMLG